MAKGDTHAGIDYNGDGDFEDANEQDWVEGGGTPNGGGGGGGGTGSSGDYWEDLARRREASFPGANQYYTDPVTGTVWDAPAAPLYEAEYVGSDVFTESPVNELKFDQLGPSAMEGVTPRKRAVQAQWDALEGMQDIYKQGGLTAIDRARIAQTRADEDAYLRGQSEASAAEMNARGMGGSNQELLSQLVGQQGAGQRMMQAGLDTNALALQRRDAALQGVGDMGTQIRGQAWDEDAARAAARDAISGANWSAGVAGRTATWEAGNDRESRNADRRTDHSRYESGRMTDWNMRREEMPYIRHAQRFGDLEAGAGIAGQGRAASTAEKNADTAKYGAKTDRIGAVGDLINTLNPF